MRAIVVLLSLTIAAGASAQGLPSEPITFGGGRVVLGGAFTATIAGADPGFYNYTNYDYSALRNLRFALTAEVRAHERVQVLSEIRVERGRMFEPHALYARIRPWLSRRIDVQVGRVPPTFGRFGRGNYGSANLLIGYPLSYQYLTSLRSDALPATPEDLVRMRGRGWRVNYPLGSRTPAPGLPVVDAFRWDTGVQVHGVTGILEWTGSVTAGSLSNPRIVDDNARRQIAGRVVLNPTPSLSVGMSAARGAFLSESLQPFVGNTGAIEDAVQRGLGVDAEYSIGRFLARGEVIWSRWSMPASLATGPLTSSSILGEARYRVLPGVHVALRAEHLGFNTIAAGARTITWDAPVTRYEAGGGWSVIRNVMVKASWQTNSRGAGRVQHETLGAAQIVYWF